jgi:CheY-like chemotaxis protein
MNRILIIDDHRGYRDSVTELITSLYPQAQVLQAINGREGVALAVREIPDLILMDAHMPFMNGYEAARLLQTMPQTCLIPIIGMTLEETNNEGVTDDLRPFCHALLLKPFSDAQLAAALQQIERRRKRVSVSVHLLPG